MDCEYTSIGFAKLILNNIKCEDLTNVPKICDTLYRSSTVSMTICLKNALARQPGKLGFIHRSHIDITREKHTSTVTKQKTD